MFKATHNSIIKYKRREFQIFKNIVKLLIMTSSFFFVIAIISRYTTDNTNNNIGIDENKLQFVENLSICETMERSDEKIQCLDSAMNELSQKRKEYYEKLVFRGQSTHKVNNSDDFGIDLDRGYWHGLTAEKHHMYDPYFAQAMLDFFKNEKVYFLADFGAGLGKYDEMFEDNGFFVTCYDGNPRTQDLSFGRCSSMDLSKPVRIPPHDWVISLEVGEHIPQEFEHVFLQNLDRANKYGLILSWAIIGQTGDGHFNNHNNSYITEKLETEYNYKFDQISTDLLRSKTYYQHFANTVMVFRKLISTPSILDIILSWL